MRICNSLSEKQNLYFRKQNALVTNFVSEKSSSWYAQLYKKDALVGGHVIMLGHDPETRYENCGQLMLESKHLVKQRWVPCRHGRVECMWEEVSHQQMHKPFSMPEPAMSSSPPMSFEMDNLISID